MRTSDFLLSARLDASSLEVWVTAGWLLPSHDGTAAEFSEVDVARALLIHDLRDMGVNDDGISVILNLIDQLHGVRRALRELLLLAGEQRGHMQGEPGDRWDVSHPGRTSSRPPRKAHRPMQ